MNTIDLMRYILAVILIAGLLVGCENSSTPQVLTAATSTPDPTATPTIPTPTPTPQVHVVGTGTTYVVQSGDSLWKIAQRFGVTLDLLVEANRIVDHRDVLQVNQPLTIPLPWACQESTRSPTMTSTHNQIAFFSGGPSYDGCCGYSGLGTSSYLVAGFAPPRT